MISSISAARRVQADLLAAQPPPPSARVAAMACAVVGDRTRMNGYDHYEDVCRA
jgi:hypothetical protein